MYFDQSLSGIVKLTIKLFIHDMESWFIQRLLRRLMRNYFPAGLDIERELGGGIKDSFQH